MIDYGKKGYKIATVALVFALIAISISGQVGQNGTNGTNGTSSILGTLSFALHNTSSDIAYNLQMSSVIVADVSKTQRFINNTQNGDTIIANWTSSSLNLTYIPAGAIYVHIHAMKIDGVARDDALWFDVGIVNSTGGNFSSIGISIPSTSFISTTEQEFDLDGVMFERITNSTDRIMLRLYVNQVGGGGTPDIIILMDDLTIARLTIPAIPIDLTSLINDVGNNTANINLKVNKSGDTMTGILHVDNIQSNNGVNITAGGIGDTGIRINLTTLEFYSGFVGTNQIFFSILSTNFTKPIDLGLKNITNVETIQTNNIKLPSIPGTTYTNLTFETDIEGFEAGTRNTTQAHSGTYSLIPAYVGTATKRNVTGIPTTISFWLWLPTGSPDDTIEFYWNDGTRRYGLTNGYPTTGKWGTMTTGGSWIDSGISVGNTSAWQKVEFIRNAVSNVTIIVANGTIISTSLGASDTASSKIYFYAVGLYYIDDISLVYAVQNSMLCVDIAGNVYRGTTTSC